MRYSNNPGNLRYSARNNWLGQIQSKNGFCQFSAMRFGLRALCLTLLSYYTRHGLRTIEEVINRYCPAGDGDNDPEAYIDYVYSVIETNHGEPEALFIDEYTFCLLVAAICYMETGYTLTPDEESYVQDLLNE